MFPLKFVPIFKTKVWGGDRISAYKGLSTDLPKVGESWEISSVPGSVSVVCGGPLDGLSLTRAMELYGPQIVGDRLFAAYGTEFPLLVKLIDAESDLSIQVHPDDATAQRLNPGHRGKSEMWYVIGADKGARLTSGFSGPVTPQEYDEHVRNNTITDLLSSHVVSPGDVFFLPAGRIHAIGAGTLVVEIQPPSDLTYRIYDYGRLGLDGSLRELHIAQAREAIDFSVSSNYRTGYPDIMDEDVNLVECEYFTACRIAMTKEYSKDLSALDSFLAVVCVDGYGTLVDSESDGSVHEVSLRQGETVLVPATSHNLVFRPGEGGMTCLTSFIGK
ncbi:MAG: type I phosphomannose isomerase catalytic subunit [Candidatus Cryptobacteroides sp.]